MTGMIGGSDKSVMRIQALVREFTSIHCKGSNAYSPSNVDSLTEKMTKNEIVQAMVQLTYLVSEWRK